MFIIITVLLIFLIAFIGAPGSLALECKRFVLANEQRKNGKKKFKVKTSLSDKLQAYCPLWQIVYTHMIYYGEPGWTAVVAFVVIGLLFLRLMVFFFVPETVLLVITSIGSIVAILLHQLIYTIVYMDIAIMYGLPKALYVAIIIFPQCASVFMSHMLPEAMLRVSKEVDDTFKESI